MTTLELLTELNAAEAEMQEARRNQDWLGVQESALKLAKLAQKIQVQEKPDHVLVDHKTASAWFHLMRRAAA